MNSKPNAPADVTPEEVRSPLTPEARRKRFGRTRGRVEDSLQHLRPGSKAFEVTKRVLVGTYTDGFIHAGNLAYLTLLTLFPFFIVLAALAHVFGRTEDGLLVLQQFLRSVPPSVAEVLTQPINDVLAARSGSLLWLGALAGLWSTGGFVGTIKDIIYRAYGVTSTAAFWKARLLLTGLTIGAVVLMLVSFVAQALMAGAEQFIVHLFPFVDQSLPLLLSLSRLIPGLAIFAALYLLFYLNTPRRYRRCKVWPGPLFIAVWWLIVTSLLPRVLALLGGYDLTYGGLAGVIIALLFFFTIGLGVVIGAHLNAALADDPEPALKEAAQEPKEAV